MAFRAARALMAVAGVVTTAAVVDAQPVLLQLRPRVGDTLRVSLQQQVEMTGMPPGCEDQAAARLRATRTAGACADVRSVSRGMDVFSRAIVKKSMRDATEILAITDSVRVSTGKRGADSRTAKESASRAPVQIRISSDGGVEVGAGAAGDDMRALLGQMPPTLSRKAVAVGEKWVHQMRVPLPGEPGAFGLVRTTFQLDSLGRSGQIAFISMRGAMSHDHSDGSDSETTGTLVGSMQFDRRLSWITETHATIDVWSVLRSPPGEKAEKPMRVHTRVVQSLRVDAQ